MGQITEDQAKLLVKEEIEQAQEKCPLRQSVARVEVAADLIQRESFRYAREHGELMIKMAARLENHSKAFERQASTNSRVEDDIRRITDEFTSAIKEGANEDKVIHGRVTGLIWWLLGTCVASCAGLIGIIVILIQLFWRN